MNKAIIYFCFSLILLSCNRTQTLKDFYSLSKQDSLLKARHLPPLPFPRGEKYYSNIVLIFDTANKIYLYQVELQSTTSENRYIPLDYGLCCMDE